MNINLKPYSESLIRVLGVILLVIGLIGLFYGPLEIYCFYMFSAGGQFYYDGFQIGSLWFAYLTIQNAVYYIVAFFMIPIGIGTIKLKNWGRKLSLNLLYIWLIVGISLTISFITTTPQLSQKLNLFVTLIIFVFICLMGIIIPFILIKIYNSQKIKHLFKNKSNNCIDKISQVILLVCCLNILFILFLHTSPLFQYIFPLFGKIIIHREAVPYISICVVFLAILTYGYYKKYLLAFWGLIVYYGLLLVSIILTFSKYSVSEIITLLNYPVHEQNVMIPLLYFVTNYTLTAFLASFITITLCLIIYSRKSFYNKKILT